MNQVVIINGPSCAGKTTIAKELCKISDNKFVHLQIDKTSEFYGTIFLKDFYLQQMRSAQRITMMVLIVYLIIIVWHVERLLPLYCLVQPKNY